MSNNQIDNTKIIYNENESNPELRLQGQWVNGTTPLSAANLNAMLDAVKKSTIEIANIPGLQNSIRELSSDLEEKADKTVVAAEIDKIYKDIDNIQSGGTDLNNYYTKAQSDNKFATKESLEDLETNGLKTKESLNITYSVNGNETTVSFNGEESETINLTDLDIEAPEYKGGNGITISDNVISADLINVYTATEDDTNKIPNAASVKENLDLKLEGQSSKYTVTKKGWHRILNTIRGNGGRLNLTLTDGFSLQSLEIDLSGFVKIGKTSPNPDESGYVFCKSTSSFLGPRQNMAQSDPYFKYKITAMRMGYASDAMNSVKYDPAVSAGNSINVYIDIYIDTNIDEDDDSNLKAQLLTQFTGKSYQHNCYPIQEETTDENYTVTISSGALEGKNVGTSQTLDFGLYGETLSFIQIPIRDDYDVVENGYKKKIVDNFNVIVGETESSKGLNDRSNIENISRLIFDDPFQTDTFNYRLFRKYNMLPLYVNTDVNDYVSTYNWKNGAVNGKYLGGGVIYPNRSGKKTCGSCGFSDPNKSNTWQPLLDNDGNNVKISYNITESGTIIFDVTNPPLGTKVSGKDYYSGIFSSLNLYYNDAASSIVLTPGIYMTNISELFYSNNLSSVTQNKINTKNYVTGNTTNKCFKIQNTVYLTNARLVLTKNSWKNSNGALATYTPFIIKVPDDIQLKSTTDTNVFTINDPRWNNFSVKSNLQPTDTFTISENGWMELTNDSKKKDFIIIENAYTNERLEIKHFSEFYTSWRAHGTFDSSVKEIDFNKNKVELNDEAIIWVKGNLVAEEEQNTSIFYAEGNEYPEGSKTLLTVTSVEPQDLVLSDGSYWTTYNEDIVDYTSFKVGDTAFLVKTTDGYYELYQALEEKIKIAVNNNNGCPLLNTYNMFVDKSENPYDTLFMSKALVTTTGKIFNNEILDIKGISGTNNPIRISQNKPTELSADAVWIKPLTQEIVPPAVYIKKAGTYDLGNSVKGTYYINSDDTFDFYVSADGSDFEEDVAGHCHLGLSNIPFNFYTDTSKLMVIGNVVSADQSCGISIFISNPNALYIDLLIRGPHISAEEKESYTLSAHIRGYVK
jgi:hypothetical protein